MRVSSLLPAAVAALTLILAVPADAKVVPVSRDPYAGAIVVDADTGQVLFEKNADLPAYPASTVKLMDLLIVLEQIDQGRTSLSNVVDITRDASAIGGTQVWLEEKESFPVEELIYAMMIQSANDAATALAIHIAGSKDGFVDLLNKRAKELGMDATVFRTVHGLPPPPKSSEQPDVTTPRDMATLARALVKHPQALVFTSVRSRPFRPERVEGKGRVNMLTHNHLLSDFSGCDGLKTGYFKAAGYSVVATAKRNDRRVICVVMGSESRTTRDAEAAKLMAKAFLELPPLPPPPPVITNLPPVAKVAAVKERKPLSWTQIGLFIGIGILVIWGIASFAMRRSRPTEF